MTAPFQWIPADRRKWTLIVLALASAVLIAGLYVIGKPLELPESEEALTGGILDIEMPVNPARADRVVSAWESRGLVDTASRQTMLDFLFLCIYPATLSLFCMLLADRRSGFMAALGIAFSWAVLFCTPLDAFENLLILRMLGGETFSPFPELATFVARMKFSLVISALFGYPFLLLLQSFLQRFVRLR